MPLRDLNLNGRAGVLRGQTEKGVLLDARPLANHVLASLPPSELALLMPHFRFNLAEPGSLLQEQGSRLKSVCFPLSGVLSFVSVMQGGEGVGTIMIGREGAAGTLSALGSRTALARTIVQLPALICSLPVPALTEAVDRSPAVREILAHYNESLFAQLQQTATCNALHSVDNRVARCLLQLADRVESTSLSVTQESLSELLGVRRTTVTVAAQRFQASGLTRTRRGQVEIIDRLGLEREACECYRPACRPVETIPNDLSFLDDRDLAK